MIVRLDHVGVVAYSWDEAAAVLTDKMGFPVDAGRTTLPEGHLFVPQNTRTYHLNVGDGETRIEILVPQDTTSGIARWLAKRGPSLHHLGYASDDVQEDARLLRERGLRQIDLGGIGAPFFYPKDVLGILTEIVPARRPALQ
jgi:methylmalonyl-CoA/ethylmalonyl-CoA epimerase